MARRAKRDAAVAPRAQRPPPPSPARLLREAVDAPGVISRAYFHFHAYSVMNQWLALFECISRNLDPGPIHTFKGWLALGRHVRKGEKAITLCMPVSRTEKADADERPGRRAQPDTGQRADDPQSTVTRRRFIYRGYWFVLSQTDGEPVAPTPVPGWDEALALRTLAIEKTNFTMLDGNVQGYARDRKVAVSPIAYQPVRTLLHEVAHVVLGHTAERRGMVDHGERTPRDLREVEAEATAYIVTQSLGLDGGEFSRGYLQHWLHGRPIEERTAQRIFHAADLILKAGRERPVGLSDAQHPPADPPT